MNEVLNPNPEPENIPMERAVILLKPGYLEHIDRLTEYLTEKGLTILEQKTVQFNEESAKSFYPHAETAINQRFGEDKDGAKAEMKRFIDYISSGEAVALLVEGENALGMANRLRDKVRQWFKLERPNDAIHGSSSVKEAERESEALGLGDCK